MSIKTFNQKSLSYFMLVFLLLTACLLDAQKVQLQKDQHYNVLLIVVDDMNDRCSFLGNNEVLTPNLQRLVSRGMVFTHAYCQYPMCNASRTSFLSGWRPDKTQIFNNNVRPSLKIDPSVVYLPEYFSQNSYHTERYGKIMHGLFENDCKWDYAEPAEGNNDENFLGGKWWIENIPVDSTDNGIEARHLISRMRQSQTFPFFYGLGLHTHNPFTPNLNYWNLNGDASVQELLPVDEYGTITGLKGNGSASIILPSTPLNDRNDVPAVAFPSQIHKTNKEWKRTIHAYDSEVAQMDAQLGLVLDEMDQQNLWANTIVIFFSDHGQHLGEHEGLWLKNTLFEESLHIPFIICVPGKNPGVCSRLIESVDIYPTLAELCNLPSPQGMEGSSFAPLLDNPNLPWKKAVFSQVSRSKKLMARSVRTEQFRYTSWGASGEELYNHFADPHEYKNLANNPNYATVLREMRKILADGWAASLPPRYATKVFNKHVNEDGLGNSLIANSEILSSVQSSQTSLLIYPNPSNGNITIEYNSSTTGKTSLAIYDETGNIVFNASTQAIKGINTKKLNLSSLGKGLYYLQLNNSNEQKRIAFIITR